MPFYANFFPTVICPENINALRSTNNHSTDYPITPSKIFSNIVILTEYQNISVPQDLAITNRQVIKLMIYNAMQIIYILHLYTYFRTLNFCDICCMQGRLIL